MLMTQLLFLHGTVNGINISLSNTLILLIEREPPLAFFHC